MSDKEALPPSLPPQNKNSEKENNVQKDEHKDDSGPPPLKADAEPPMVPEAPKRKRKSRFDRPPPGVKAKKSAFTDKPADSESSASLENFEKALKNARRYTSNSASGATSFEANLPIPQSLLDDMHLNFVGLVIGPGGNTQKKLQKDLQARIAILAPGGEKVSKDTTQGLYFVLSTTTQQKLDVAVAYITQLIEEPAQREALRLDQTSAAAGLPVDIQGGRLAEIMMIPSEKVGILIGKRGETIQDIMTKTGALLKVERDHNPEHPATREVTIQGSPEQIECAKEIVKGYCSDKGIRADGQMEYEETMAIPQNLVGIIIGKSGESIKSIQAISHCNVMIVAKDGGLATDLKSVKVVKMRGTVSELASAKQQINALTGRYQTPETSMHRPLGSEEEIIAIPTTCVGTLLGRGGESVKRLAFLTATRIQVLPPDQQQEEGFDSVSYKKVSIKGDIECIEKAKTEIQNLIDVMANIPKSSQDIINPYGATSPEEGYSLMQKYMKQQTSRLPDWAVGSNVDHNRPSGYGMQSNYGYNQNKYASQAGAPPQMNYAQYGHYSQYAQAPTMQQGYPMYQASQMHPHAQMAAYPPGISPNGGAQMYGSYQAALPAQAPAPPPNPPPAQPENK